MDLPLQTKSNGAAEENAIHDMPVQPPAKGPAAKGQWIDEDHNPAGPGKWIPPTHAMSGTRLKHDPPHIMNGTGLTRDELREKKGAGEIVWKIPPSRGSGVRERYVIWSESLPAHKLAPKIDPAIVHARWESWAPDLPVYPSWVLGTQEREIERLQAELSTIKVELATTKAELLRLDVWVVNLLTTMTECPNKRWLIRDKLRKIMLADETEMRPDAV